MERDLRIRRKIHRFKRRTPAGLARNRRHISDAILEAAFHHAADVIDVYCPAGEPALLFDGALEERRVLGGVTQATVAETITLGCIAALIQCLWKPRTPPAVIQVLFNIAALIVSIAVSFSVSHALVQGTNLLILLAVAVCAYFLLNTGMISLVLSLTGGTPFSEVWRQCYLWSFPYYLVGAAIAGAIVFSNRTVGWKPSLLMLPMMYLVYSYYRLYLLQITDQEGATPVIFKSLTRCLPFSLSLSLSLSDPGHLYAREHGGIENARKPFAAALHTIPAGSCTQHDGFWRRTARRY
jgi:hypothetical protein